MTTTARPGPVHPTVAWILGVAIAVAMLAGGVYAIVGAVCGWQPIVDAVTRLAN